MLFSESSGPAYQLRRFPLPGAETRLKGWEVRGGKRDLPLTRPPLCL